MKLGNAQISTDFASEETVITPTRITTDVIRIQRAVWQAKGEIESAELGAALMLFDVELSRSGDPVLALSIAWEEFSQAYGGSYELFQPIENAAFMAFNH